MKQLHVLQVPLLVTHYEELGRLCLDWAKAPQCRAIEFVNTQIVAMQRHEPAFAAVMQAYDDQVPDGMPLVWCLNRARANLRDRVYGPTFMRRFLETAPPGTTHYLLGGSAACGTNLKDYFQRQNPNLKFVGAFHGRCYADGTLEGAAETAVIAEINQLSPDFIWVGFGTPKQQAWTQKHKAQIRRGVILSVGFAFDVNAGTKSDAPAWMQRSGLTWLHRMGSEPRRLIPRYFKWNFLFLLYLLCDGCRGRAYGKLPGNLIEQKP